MEAEALKNAIREEMTPQAIALTIAYLQGAKAPHQSATTEVGWLCDRLTELVGGPKMLSKLFDEIGV